MNGKSGEVTIRRSFDYYFGWILTVFVLVLTVDGFRYGQPGNVRTNVMYLTVMFPIAWLGWLVTVHPRIVVSDSGLRIVNWFTSHYVPWSAISEISSNGRLEIRLGTGGKIRPAIGSVSMVGASWRRRIRRLLEAALSERLGISDDDLPRRKLDVKPAPFVILFIVLLWLAWVMG